MLGARCGRALRRLEDSGEMPGRIGVEESDWEIWSALSCDGRCPLLGIAGVR